jgi:hypothetical protein
MTRTASCSCGKLTLVVTGDPKFVLMCHCRECQRRTGSIFGVGAYYLRAQVQPAGTFNIYVRDAQEGRKARSRFCPTCGSTVFWEIDRQPDYIGVAVGAMADPQFRPPMFSVWEDSQHPWITLSHAIKRFPQQF